MVRNLHQYPITHEEKIKLLVKMRAAVALRQREEIGSLDYTILGDIMSDVATLGYMRSADQTKPDVRGYSWAWTKVTSPPKPYGMSQTEIIETLRGNMSMSVRYTLDQLIADIDHLTPIHLDSWSLKLKPSAASYPGWMAKQLQESKT